MTKHYNIIGDIHGRKCWKELVQDDCVNVFVGDYFDPYEKIPYEQLMQNFRDIIAYKESHPKTVLLYGNHDLHYLSDADRSSRYDALHAEQNKQFFLEHQHLFTGIAFAFGKYLVTHAGVTKEWYEKEFGEYHGKRPFLVAKDINELWQHNKLEFSFRANVTLPLDLYGESSTHSPAWIRPWVLAEHNLFTGTPYKQIFGHTQIDDITTIDDNLICVDCLGTTQKSYKI